MYVPVCVLLISLFRTIDKVQNKEISYIIPSPETSEKIHECLWVYMCQLNKIPSRLPTWVKSFDLSYSYLYTISLITLVICYPHKIMAMFSFNWFRMRHQL
jgi:hypothetical protein